MKTAILPDGKTPLGDPLTMIDCLHQHDLIKASDLRQTDLQGDRILIGVPVFLSFPAGFRVRIKDRAGIGSVRGRSVPARFSRKAASM